MKSIKRIIRDYFFKKQLKKVNRNKKVINYSDADTIGILYDASKEDDYSYITLLVRELQKDSKKVKTVGYIRQKEMPSYGYPKLTFEFCDKKEFSLSFKPKKMIIKDFIEYPFDILIDLSPKDIYEFKYISGLSRAKLKVGKYGEKWNGYYDLLLKVGQNCSNEEFMKHCLHYLKILKN